jgi:general secretion pathway protein M
LAATFTPVLAALVLAIVPICDLLADRDVEIARNVQMLAKLTGIAAYKPKLPPAGGLIGASDEYLKAPSQGVATANLQARLKVLSEASGARLRSVQGMPTQSEGRISYIGARLEIFGPIQAVQRAIGAIEEAKPYFFVTSAVIKRSALSVLPDNQAAEPVIDAQLDVAAAFLQEGSQ